ncbi:Non-specific serine/threonine protein kinase protein [Dioscorea alata]|uniref:Non-specific serine/threonine protein kinase protein n=1 Tax=Dioscorea alata TaxID=55571 RepID=A0ACB7V7Q6_DIOAL|nr:Non-specific serine/threonine protein kinase protein [Dioscorea alata]
MPAFLLYLLQLLLLLLALQCSDELNLCNAATLVPIAKHPANCIESERIALLDFKKNITDPNNCLSSWVGQDCCSWEGVYCDNLTGNIVGLELNGPDPMFSSDKYYLQMRGEISPSLLQLQHLNYLDLSWNDFSGTNFPSFISQLKELKYLNLSGVGFQGSIPAGFGNLSSLQTLDLSYNNLLIYEEHADHEWLSHLTSLQHLDLTQNNIGNSSIGLFLALNKLPSISELHLSSCNLEKLPLSFPHLNFSSLSILDLSNNNINFSGISWVFNIKSLQYLDLYSLAPLPTIFPSSRAYIGKIQPSEISIPESIGSLCSLQTLDLCWLNISKTLVELGGVFSDCLKHSLTHLYLRGTFLKGDILDWIGDIKNLKVLDLSQNSLSGSVPPSLSRLTFLEELQLCYNQLTGTLPEEIGNLAQLEYMNLAQNQLSGVISEAHFTQLEKLETLDFSQNSLIFNVSSNWVPPFLLKELSISSCSVGPEFPAWLQTQHNLSTLNMSSSGINDTVPEWVWNLTSHNLAILDLSNNHIKGMIPKILTFTQIEKLDLSSNLFSGPLPDLHMHSPMVNYIDLSYNSFSGPIPRIMLNDTFSSNLHISISMNKLNGSVPDWLCQMMEEIEGIDISKNHLSGELPHCWLESSIVSYINLAYNNISGAIPNSIGHLRYLNSLLLNHNKLSGELPNSLKNCSQLLALDLSYNNFTGSIPTWIGERLPLLTVLILKQNAFVNNIPQEISQLEYLQVLDLSSNDLSGPIPKSLSNLTSMQMLPKTTQEFSNFLQHNEIMFLSLSGREDEYGEYRIGYVKYIDLSNNELSGCIPEELASLDGLQSLNLSGNTLQCEIPDKLGRMKQLKSLDLSRNKLSGSIPSTLANLTFLGLFNVSHNNLSGRIPLGNQFNTFTDPTIYTGNHLCGFPLSDNCTKDGGTSKEGPKYDEPQINEDDDDILWLYIGSLSGFAVGSSVVWIVLALKKKWRHAYFRSADNTYDKIYVFVVVRFRRMKKKFMPNN